MKDNYLKLEELEQDIKNLSSEEKEKLSNEYLGRLVLINGKMQNDQSKETIIEFSNTMLIIAFLNEL